MKKKEDNVFKQMWLMWVERAKTRKAMRMMIKQEWSVDFLTAMLIRAANTNNRPYEMDIINKDGMTLRIRTIEKVSSAYKDDSIFNHLDNELKVQNFINEVNNAKNRL